MPRKIKGQQSQIKRCTPEDAAPKIAALGHEIMIVRDEQSPPFMGSDGEYHCGYCGAPVDGGGVYQEPERA